MKKNSFVEWFVENWSILLLILIIIFFIIFLSPDFLRLFDK